MRNARLEEAQAGTRKYLKRNWHYTAHNSSKEIPRYIFTIIIFYFFMFKFFITSLIFICITYYYRVVEPGRLPSMGSYRVQHDWSDLAAATAETN